MELRYNKYKKLYFNCTKCTKTCYESYEEFIPVVCNRSFIAYQRKQCFPTARIKNTQVNIFLRCFDFQASPLLFCEKILLKYSYLFATLRIKNSVTLITREEYLNVGNIYCFLFVKKIFLCASVYAKK